MLKLTMIGFLLSMNLYSFDILTEDLPPFNFKDKNSSKVIGISTDVVNEILKEINDDTKITILPWSRAYKRIISKPNQILFSMTRTKQREKMFKWVGPLVSSSWVFYAKKDSDIKINKLEDAKNERYKIGSYFDDVKESFLKKNNFPNIYSVPNDSLNLKKLLKGRINLWIEGEIEGLFIAKQIGINPKKIKKIFTIKETKLYIAFSLDTPNKVINKWQCILNKIKMDGRYDDIVDKYLK